MLDPEQAQDADGIPQRSTPESRLLKIQLNSFLDTAIEYPNHHGFPDVSPPHQSLRTFIFNILV